MRCRTSQVQRWSLRGALGACSAFGACVLMAAAANGQAPIPPSQPATVAAPAKDKAAAPAKKTAAAPAPKKNKKAVPVQKKASGARAESVTVFAAPTKSVGAEPSIGQALRMKSDFEFKEAPLADVVEVAQEVDKTGDSVGQRGYWRTWNVTSDTPVTFSAKNMSVQNALGFMLRSMQPELAWVTKDNILLITTPDVASDTLEIRVYAVQDLVAQRPSYPFQGMYVPGVSTGGFPGTPPAGSGGNGGMGGMGAGSSGAGGGMFSVPDNVSRVSKHASRSPRVLAQVSPPPKGGAARGGAKAGAPGGTAQQPGESGLIFSTQDLIDTITSCVKPTTWDAVGAPGSIMPVGGMLIINQTASIHEEIEKLLEDLRASTPGLKTVTIRATWLLLDLKQLDQLSSSKPGKDGGINRRALDEMAAKAKGYIGAITCLNGQTVHIASGRNHSAVVGAVPVVGGGEGENVGYQPIMSNPQSGAMLQITPQILPNSQMILLDLCSSVTRAEISPEPIHFLGGEKEKADAKKDANASRPAGGRTTMNLDRVNVVVGQLATTLRVPLGQPTLVGGLTREPAVDEKEAADTPQLYLFIEATAK